jgi:excisionase family DNA binding protein
MEFLTIREASHYLNVKQGTLYAWVGKRKIPFHKMNGLIRFRRSELDHWLEGNERKVVDPVLNANQIVTKILASLKNTRYPSQLGKPGQN